MNIAAVMQIAGCGLVLAGLLVSDALAAPGAKLAGRAVRELRSQPRPTPFVKALEKALEQVKAVEEAKAKLKEAKTAEEKAAAQQAVDQAVNAASESLTAARRLIREDDPENDQDEPDDGMVICYGLYLQTYIFLQQKHNYEAAILGEKLARMVMGTKTRYGLYQATDNLLRQEFVNYAAPMLDRQLTPQIQSMEALAQEPKCLSQALDATVFAMTAMQQEYVAAPENDRDFERSQFKRICEVMIELFPDAAQAHEARLTLARIYHIEGNLLQSAEVYETIPPGTAPYIDAQLQSGQVYWILYLDPDKLPKDFDRNQRGGLMAEAEKHLREGIARSLEASKLQNPPPVEPDEKTLLAKISLAQILIQQNKFQEAVDLITKDPWAPVKAVEFKPPTPQTQRPATGNKSLKTASFVYRNLLQAYVGLGNIDAARQTMVTLEELLGDTRPEYLTENYLDLGRKLKQQLTILKEEGQTERYEQVKKSFETLLEDIAKRESGLNRNSLLWIATTYNAFGDTAPDAASASGYYEKSAQAYQTMLDRDAQDDNFLSTGLELAVKLEMARAYTRARNYDAALNLLAAILAKQSGALDAQIEAATILQTRAEEEGQPQLYLDAIHGVEIGDSPKTKILGWSQIALQLQKRLDNQRNRESSSSLLGWQDLALGLPSERQKLQNDAQKSTLTAAYEEKHINAWYQQARCRQAYAETQQGDARKMAFDAAILELATLSRVISRPSPEWVTKLNELYGELRQAANQKPEPLWDENVTLDVTTG